MMELFGEISFRNLNTRNKRKFKPFDEEIDEKFIWYTPNQLIYEYVEREIPNQVIIGVQDGQVYNSHVVNDVDYKDNLSFTKNGTIIRVRGI